VEGDHDTDELPDGARSARGEKTHLTAGRDEQAIELARQLGRLQRRCGECRRPHPSRDDYEIRCSETGLAETEV